MLIFLSLIDTKQDQRLFVTIYEKYKYLVYKIVHDIVHDTGYAEDVVQEVFVKVAKNIEKIDYPDSLRTKRYLITISKNTSIDFYRKLHKILEKEVYFDEVTSDTALYYSSKNDSEHENKIYDAIRNLPVKYRDIIILKYSSGYTNSEIADIMNISEDNVRQRISRGKKIIELNLSKWEGNTE